MSAAIALIGVAVLFVALVLIAYALNLAEGVTRRRASTGSLHRSGISTAAKYKE
jgi:hypothetical protein